MEWRSIVHFGFGRDEETGKWKFLLKGNPFAIIIIIILLGFLLYSLFYAGAMLVTGYFPYEGTVIRIERDFVHDVFSEDEDDRLVIRTPEGKEIERMVSMYVRVSQRIFVGSYVVKEKGFFKKPKVINKKD